MANYIKTSCYSKFTRLAMVFALVVIMLGAYTRLSDAGLGCPDWPGCYGKLIVPHSAGAMKAAQKVYPHIPLQTTKAWAEMVHRYFAGTLGMLIVILAIWGSIRYAKKINQPIIVPWLLVALAGLQALLGMWTVTLKLLPDVVSAHLIGGMTIAALLLWLALSTQFPIKIPAVSLKSTRPWVIAGLVITALQIFLGAWTSTNYAALACPHFPLCQGSLFPHMEWAKAFNFLSPIGPNYEGGKLDILARMTIQMAHRYGAFISFTYLCAMSLCFIIRKNLRELRSIGITILILVLSQVMLGILNVELMLPIQTAVAHNGVAALLLLAVVTAVHRSFYSRAEFASE